MSSGMKQRPHPQYGRGSRAQISASALDRDESMAQDQEPRIRAMLEGTTYFFAVAFASVPFCGFSVAMPSMFF
jgi:hypothetical protein